MPATKPFPTCCVASASKICSKIVGLIAGSAKGVVCYPAANFVVWPSPARCCTMAPLMLLDEPTEGLDATTESEMLELLADVMREKTVLMVTHRLRGLARFDQIIVMDDGHIIERGTHAELLAGQGRYYQFKQRL
ncbi:transport ATP-binding protein CydC [Salmonella enterica subsp. enterica]|nr:transport ATP-binding protein CydC [Salmonella enterica subsp. enterica]